MGVIRKEGISSGIYLYIGLVLGFVNGTLLFPKIMGPEIYGFTQWLLSVGVVLTLIGNLGVPNTVVKYFPHFRDIDAKHHGFLTFVLTLSATGILLAASIALLGKDAIMSWFRKAKSMELAETYYYLVIPVAIFKIISNVFTAYAKSLLKAGTPTFFNEVYGRLVDMLLLLLYFYQIIDLPLFIQLFTYKIGLRMLLLAAYVKMQGQLLLPPDWSIFRSQLFRQEMWQFGLFTIFAGISTVIINKIDVLMLSAYSGFGDVGVYMVFFFVAQVIIMPHNGIANIVAPVLAKAWKNDDQAKVADLYRRTSLNHLVVGLFIYIAICVNLDNIIAVLGPDYARGKNVAVLLGLSQLFHVGGGVNGLIIINSKHFRFDLVNKLFLAALTVATNLIFIPRYGIIGAALATAITIFMSNALKMVFIQWRMGMQPFSMNTLKTIVLAAIVAAVGYLLPALPHWLPDLVYRTTAIGLLYLILFYTTNTAPDLSNFARMAWNKARKAVGRQ